MARITRRLTRRQVLAASIGVVAVAGCTGDGEGAGSGEESDGEASATPTAQAELTVVDHRLNYSDVGYATVSGVVRNNTDYEMGYVQLQAYFYDPGGTRIGEGLWNASNLGAGVRAEFETTPAQTASRPADYELRGSGRRA